MCNHYPMCKNLQGLKFLIGWSVGFSARVVWEARANWLQKFVVHSYHVQFILYYFTAMSKPNVIQK